MNNLKVTSKIFLFFAISFVFLFSINLVAAETCTDVGEVAGGKYCDVDGVLKDWKADGVSCLNNYECEIQACSEGICQEKYSSFFNSENSLQELLNLLSGYECTPGEDDCADDKKLIRTCGARGAWEMKNAYVDGKCGYSSGGGSSSIQIIISSPRNITYGITKIPLQVKDNRGIANYWRYSLNGGAKTDFVSGAEINARAGSNSLVIYARQSSSSSETSKAVIFGVVLSASSYCGDKICNSNEDCTDCVGDCGGCIITLGYCGDGNCDDDESSFTCSADCEAKKPNSKWWVFLIIIVLILAIVLFFLRHKIRNSQWFQKLFQKQHP